MSNIPKKPVPNGVLVTDNGGSNKEGGTHDQFTVSLPNGDCYSMSVNVMAKTNFPVCMFHGNNLKHDPSEQPRDEVPVHVFQKIQALL